MGKGSLISDRNGATPFLAHASGFLVVFFLSMWLRVVPLQSDPILQGYLQVTTGLLAFVFAAVTLVRFQGTQDRISLILGSGFLLSGTLLTASSLLFFIALAVPGGRAAAASHVFAALTVVEVRRCSPGWRRPAAPAGCAD